MDIKELESWLTEGLDDAAANAVRAALNRDTVKSKAAGLKQQREYDELQARSQALQAELDGAPDKPGTRAYQKWYQENYSKVQALQESLAAYQAKYGSLDNPANPNPANPPAGMSAEDIKKLAMEAAQGLIQNNYAARWSDLLTKTGTIVQKHMFAGRKNPINFEEVSKIAEKYNGNLEQAYDEWDKPEREKVEAKAKEDEINRRVQEELQKRGASLQFPAGADLSSGALSSRTKGELDKFDKTALKRDLVQTFMTGTATEQ